ncbi:MAG TPA: MAPEG family protein [Thermohalobaculum sp.]|nr:MAPEG family protein [Thermohalobaculum sp.]
MTPELMWVAGAALATGLMWVPYILSLIGQMGVGAALADGEHDTEIESDWARRAKRAHANAVENLVVFAPLAIGIHLAGMSSTFTANVCGLYFFARLAHYLFYAGGVPYVRTIAFAIGWACCMILAFMLMGWA